MNEPTAPYRPGLISRRPDRLAAALRAYGIHPRLLSLQDPYACPQGGSWGVLPALPSPVLLDMSDFSLAECAMVVNDLRVQQRQRQIVPLLLVPAAAIYAQRLLQASSLTAIVISADAESATIARWVRAPLRLVAGLVWVDLPALPAVEGEPHLVPLLAALGRATSMAQVAEWCALSCRKVNYILATSCGKLGIPIAAWRSPAQWAVALSDALASPNPATQQLLPSADESQCQGQQKERTYER